MLRPAPDKTDALILDHAGNTLRHGRVEDFEPTELTAIDRHTDRKRKVDAPDYFPCPECRTVLAPRTAVCGECSHVIRKRTVAQHIPGDLTEDAQQAPQHARRELRRLYAELRYYARERDYKEAWAYHKVRESYGFKCPWDWRDDDPCPPSAVTLRLIRHWSIRFAKSRRAA